MKIYHVSNRETGYSEEFYSLAAALSKASIDRNEVIVFDLEDTISNLTEAQE